MIWNAETGAEVSPVCGCVQGGERERERKRERGRVCVFFIDDQLVRILFITEMI